MLSEEEAGHFSKSLIISALSCFQKKDYRLFLQLAEKVDPSAPKDLRAFVNPAGLARYALLSLILTGSKVTPSSALTL